MAILFLIGGVLCGLYYLVLISFSGLRAVFSLFWLFLSLLLLTVYALLRLSRRFPGRLKLPLGLKVFLITSLILFLGLFLFVENRIRQGMKGREPEETPGYVIVLGAGVRGTTLSKILKQRLDTAASYWRTHPEVRLIVSGGQGPGEDITEAEAMHDYLLQAGVPRNRIIKEGRSRNTKENLTNSLAILIDPEASVALVTSDFHLFRAMGIARKMTDREVYGLPAPTDVANLPNNLAREFFAVLKDWFFGNIE